MMMACQAADEANEANEANEGVLWQLTRVEAAPLLRPQQQPLAVSRRFVPGRPAIKWEQCHWYNMPRVAMILESLPPQPPPQPAQPVELSHSSAADPSCYTTLTIWLLKRLSLPRIARKNRHTSSTDEWQRDAHRRELLSELKELYAVLLAAVRAHQKAYEKRLMCSDHVTSDTMLHNKLLERLKKLQPIEDPCVPATAKFVDTIATLLLANPTPPRLAPFLGDQMAVVPFGYEARVIAQQHPTGKVLQEAPEIGLFIVLHHRDIGQLHALLGDGADEEIEEVVKAADELVERLGNKGVVTAWRGDVLDPVAAASQKAISADWEDKDALDQLEEAIASGLTLLQGIDPCSGMYKMKEDMAKAHGSFQRIEKRLSLCLRHLRVGAFLSAGLNTLQRHFPAYATTTVPSSSLFHPVAY
ncbi:unnamed protein product [Vitrella brassicaformis CCMP3155]|uniref:Uncharacterized protein n=1 Tax=Vitrella brassicaformis (strain CCMP3155) TaxID=1169540 RepID=A0A0G4H202_VITBC|nr:unnamed protein product [Vitrella brassicaformis CCMP3155]|eukprot:CEM37432.1 unnamed protein product [Vitrella brassicaformis CCMP3155]